MPNANNTARTTATHFVPSSTMLLSMIDRAMAKCDASIEQAALRKEAQAEEQACKAWTAEAEAISRRRRWGF